MENLTEWIALGLAIVIVGYGFYTRRNGNYNITLPDTLDLAGEVMDLAPTLEEVVEDAVLAAEQFKKTGKLADNNAALDYAFSYIAQFFPEADPAQVRAKIEKYVLIAGSYIKD